LICVILISEIFGSEEIMGNTFLIVQITFEKWDLLNRLKFLNCNEKVLILESF
jgi:hypothetical protein